MAIKKRKRDGRYEVYAYNSAVGHKVYVGTRDRQRDAIALFEQKRDEFRGEKPKETLAVQDYVQRWLDYKHGKNTRREAPRTRLVNETNLKPLLEKFGGRALSGGIERSEALDWSLQHPAQAKTACAMFNDAVDDQLTIGNPFANRRQPQARGRRDIHPITEAEVDRLGEIACEHWLSYGKVCRAWIMFGAWVGARPGEYFRLEWPALDFKNGLVTIKRIKGRKQTDRAVFPERAQQAVLEMGLPRVGLVFPTITGVHMDKGASRYYWDPVRKTFLAGLEMARREELTDSKGALDLYALRHFCGSVMADRGLSEFDIAHQLGNSPEVCRETYVHTYRDRTNDRVRLALEGDVVSLDVARERRSNGWN